LLQLMEDMVLKSTLLEEEEEEEEEPCTQV